MGVQLTGVCSFSLKKSVPRKCLPDTRSCPSYERRVLRCILRYGSVLCLSL
jgi:hypothetical protein